MATSSSREQCHDNQNDDPHGKRSRAHSPTRWSWIRDDVSHDRSGEEKESEDDDDGECRRAGTESRKALGCGTFGVEGYQNPQGEIGHESNAPQEGGDNEAHANNVGVDGEPLAESCANAREDAITFPSP